VVIPTRDLLGKDLSSKELGSGAIDTGLKVDVSKPNTVLTML